MKIWTQRLAAGVSPDEPPFVKQASYAETFDHIPDTGFALVFMEKDGTHRIFPVFDMATTWLSAELLGRIHDRLPKEAAIKAAAVIDEMALTYGIEVPEIVTKLAEQIPGYADRYYQAEAGLLIKVDAAVKTAAADDASIKVGATDYPIRNLTELGSAERWFESNYTSMESYADRFKMACFIEARREELVDEKTAAEGLISTAVTKLAGLNDFNPGLAAELRYRSSLCNRMDAETNTKLGSTFRALSVDPSPILADGPVDAIAAIEELDKMAGLRPLYGNTIPDPIHAVLVHAETHEEKDAADDKKKLPDHDDLIPANSVVGDYLKQDPTALGHAITLGDLRRSVKDGKLSCVLGDSLAASLLKYPAQTYAGLPSYMRQLVVKTVLGG